MDEGKLVGEFIVVGAPWQFIPGGNCIATVMNIYSYSMYITSPCLCITILYYMNPLSHILECNSMNLYDITYIHCSGLLCTLFFVFIVY